MSKKSFSKRGCLKRHIQTHTQQTPNKSKCKECNVFLSSAGMNLHIRAEHEGVIYSCNMCPFKTQYKTSLLNHKGGHDGKSYFWKDCDKQYTYMSSLYKHRNSIHEGFIYPCNQCNYKATFPAGLKKHYRRYHQIEDITKTLENKQLACKICGKFYSCTESLKAHIRMHTSGKSYACLKCGKTLLSLLTSRDIK